MHKKLFTVLLVALIASGVMFAQSAKKAPVIVDAPAVAVESVLNVGGPSPVTAANYVAVDTMPNVYGPAIGALNPAAFDPYTNTALVVYRGSTTYSAGSGELWYGYSTDHGQSWMRSATSVNGDNAQILARYPSAAIFNPGMAEDFSETIAVFAWPELNSNPVQFQHVGFAADQGFDGADFAAITNDGDPTSTPLYSSQVPVFTHTDGDGNGYVFWMSDNTDDASITLWKTTDYSDVTEINPENWNSAAFGDNGNITMGGVSANGVAYYGVIGSFAEEFGWTNPFGGWGIGYSKSEDNGDTWSDWNLVDSLTYVIDDRASYHELWDYIKGDEFISYQGDINVDKDGYVHIVTGVTAIDTAVSDEYGSNFMVEFIETDAGWDKKIILDGELLSDSTFTQYDGVALGQMGPSVYLAFDADREFMMAQWVTHDGGDSAFCDVYAAYRHLDDAEWSDAMNLTETPGFNENGSHFAPSLAKEVTVEGGDTTTTYTGFSFYYYPAGFEYGAGVPLTDPTVYYAAPVAVSFTTVSSVEDGIGEFDYNLGQNYPNPFNPATSIKYEIAKSSNVTLKVYDVLGAEVATLVNKAQNAGSYTVNFDASNLSSGVYIYEIKAGDFVKSAKMMLLK
ncbi:MAG: hypothetical protein SCALA702_07130 [Melioribacteraceae bacterium]|nr:MAG: hypothetical protein SCALA702_07130 [Melioribacteraceae bacterium]